MSSFLNRLTLISLNLFNCDATNVEELVSTSSFLVLLELAYLKFSKNLDIFISMHKWGGGVRGGRGVNVRSARSFTAITIHHRHKTT